ATPSAEELERIKHYFINERDPDQPFSAGEFGRLARELIDRSMAAGKNLIICGGSGLYLQAVFGMIAEGLHSDETLRRQIREKAEREGWDALYAELQRLDPELAAGVDARNPKRISRALEICYAGGKKASEIFAEQERKFPYPYLHIGLDPERPLLYANINTRVRRMIEEGLPEEVKALLERGCSPDLNALNSVGYKEVIAYLQGKYDLEKAIEEIQKNTRRFAKRQITWFRKYAPDLIISYGEKESFEDILQRAKDMIKMNFSVC
ncbi:MAG: tRNA (adenosine(37)-N6)-dimethylallyltransferase MiaA, partial [Candidatus Neomarinimicrobiota bacterium]